MTRKKTAMVIGVGAERGLGAALCRRFAAEGLHVYVAGRTLYKLEQAVSNIIAGGGTAEAIRVDAAVEEDIVALFDYAGRKDSAFCVPELVVFNVGNNHKIDFLRLTVSDMENCWRAGLLGGFIVGRECARHMLPERKGTILFTGASSSLRGKPGYAHFSAAKAGLRMLSQSMAREFGPEGIHVAHVILDGGIDGELMKKEAPERYENAGQQGLLNPDEIADVFWFIHKQPPSVWTQEIDLRPFLEPF